MLRSNMDDQGIRYLNSQLMDDKCNIFSGDFLIFPDGSWSESNGDEDVKLTMDGTKKLLTRSFQNWHTHLPMLLNRGMGEGLTLMKWLEESIFPTEYNLTRELVEIGTKAATTELIRSGTTFACDMYQFPESIGPVLDEAGIRGIVCGPTTDWPPIDNPEENESGGALKILTRLLEEGSLGDGRVEYGIATHAVYTCSEEILKRASDLSTKYNARLHIHTNETRTEVAECHKKTGMYPIEYLDSIDYFTEGTVCAHCGWVTKNEMRILAKHGAHAVHCPVSNMKLATGGTMSYPAMIEQGVDVRLGTDGAASNNSLDMRQETKFASLIQKHDHWDATILNPIDSWKLATKDSLDWVAWNLEDIRMRPYGSNLRRILANLIYSNSDCLDVIVNGNLIRENGKTLTMDEGNISNELENAARSYYADI